MKLLLIYCLINYVLKTIANDFTLDKDYLKYFLSEENDNTENYIYITTKSREKRSTKYVERPGHLELHVKDDQDEYDIILEPRNNFISPQYTLVVRGENGTIEEELESHSERCLFVGSVKNRKDLPAALSNCDGNGFTGIIVDGEKTHFIRPAEKSSRHKRDVVTQEGLHIIKSKMKTGKCGVLDTQTMTASDEIIELINGEPAKIHGNLRTAKLTGNANDGRKFEIETAVFVDDEMYKHIRKTSSNDVIRDIENIVFAIMNGVALLYDSPSMRIDVDIVLVHLDIMKRSVPKLDKSGGEIMQYLSSFCNWQADQNYANNDRIWDHAIMVTGIELYDKKPENDEVIGLAWVSGMCRKEYSCTINQGTTFEAVYIISHEMGHNLGMTHDGSMRNGNNCEKNKHLMSASTGPGKIQWSVCSNKELEKFLYSSRHNPTCLTIRGQSREISVQTNNKLPGEKFNKEAQCAYNYGSNHSPYVSSFSPYNNICRELWCENGTHAVLSHPALEGTSCDRGRGVCRSGVCKSKFDTNPDPDVKDNEIPSVKPRNNNFGFRDVFNNVRDWVNRYFFLESSTVHLELRKEWALMDLNPCSSLCGGGFTFGSIVCVYGVKVLDDSECSHLSKPPSKTACNTLPCKK